MATRSEPVPWEGNYLPLRALAVQIRAAATARLGGLDGLRVLDVGCGDRPYEPIFRAYSSEYVGLDYAPGPGVDVLGRAEDLPFDDRSFDCVLATQILEHADDPFAAVREFRRVLRPGGVAFASTHGVKSFHPNPGDYWRWTHAGLERMFRMCGDWSEIDVFPNGGTATAIGYLGSQALETIAWKLRAKALARPWVFASNVAVWRLDRIYRRMFGARPPDLAANYLVVAVVPAGGER